MTVAAAFAFEGLYRVQSAARGSRSRLEGCWIEPVEDEASEALINRHLAVDRSWRGSASVRLRPALVTARIGAFEREPDILYKESNFEPAAGNEAMPANIVDVEKAAAKWRTRRPHVRALFGLETAEALEQLVGPIAVVAANEYFVHEAGHCLGYPTDRKYADGYFRLGGRTLWPLVHVEEFRADLLSFGVALRALSAARAVAIFLYNLLLRLGVHAEAMAIAAVAPYGPIPRLLFTLLDEIGWLEADGKRGTFEVRSLDCDDILDVMRQCAEHAEARLVEPPSMHDPVDAALVSAAYFRERCAMPASAAFDAFWSQV